MSDLWTWILVITVAIACIFNSLGLIRLERRITRLTFMVTEPHRFRQQQLNDQERTRNLWPEGTGWDHLNGD